VLFTAIARLVLYINSWVTKKKKH